MAANITYHEQTDMDNIRKLREVLKTLPAFAKDYFRAIEPTTSTKTRISYAYDIRIFFQFLISQNPSLAKIGIPNLNVSVLDQLKPIDIEEYMEYLKLYDSPNDQTTITNGERGLKRKISSLRSFYTYYYKRQAIKTNPVQLVDMPKIHDKAIIRLDAGETAALLDYIEHCGDQLIGQRKAYYEKTKLRDLAIVTLLLGTGIRVSECVGLDVEDIDFRNNGIRLIRKGGSEMVVYFGPEVEKALKDYLEARKAISPRAPSLLLYPAKTYRRSGGGKSGQKVCPCHHNYKKNHTTQIEKYLWYHFISGNRRHLSGCRCARAQRCEHHQKALCCHG